MAFQSYVTDEQIPRHVLLAVLSDGVGGNRAGEVAAQIGVDSIVDIFGKIKTLDDPAGTLKEVIIAANLEVLNASAVKSGIERHGCYLHLCFDN